MKTRKRTLISIIFITIFLVGTLPIFSIVTAKDLTLHVEGNKIKTSSGQTITLLGINKHAFENYPEGSWQSITGAVEYGIWNPTVVSNNLDAMKSWGLNTVRSYSTASFWIDNTENHRQIIKDYANLCAERDMYLIYTFWHADITLSEGEGRIPYPTTTIPTGQAFVDMWVSIAQELKDYPNIIFALWNEPGMYDQERANEWFPIIQQTIDAIRATGAKNLIVVQWGSFWYNLTHGGGTGLEWVDEYPLTDSTGNLVYEFHIYRNGIHKYNGDERINSYSYEDLNDGFEVLQLYHVLNDLNKPVICGEIGPNMWQTDDELQWELEFYENSLTIYNEKGISYVAFWWWPTWTYAHLIDSPNFQPNEAGQILISKVAEVVQEEDGINIDIPVIGDILNLELYHYILIITIVSIVILMYYNLRKKK